MVKSCCAYGCKEREIPKSGVSFHKFPRNAARRKKWIIALQRKNFRPTDHMRVCSKHFAESDFQTHLGRKQLKAGAIPSLFNFQQDLITRNKRTDPASRARDESCTLRISPEKNATIKGLLEPKHFDDTETDTKPLFTLNDYIEDLLKSETQSLNSTEDLKPEVVLADTQALSEENSTIKMEKDLKIEYKEDIKPLFTNEYVEKQPENASEVQNLKCTEDIKPDLTINENNIHSTPALVSSEENVTIKVESDLLEPVNSNYSEVLGLHHEEDLKPEDLNEFIEDQSSDDFEVQNFEPTENMGPVSVVKEEIEPKLMETKRTRRTSTQAPSFDELKEQDLQSEEAKTLWRVANRQINKQRSTIKALNAENRILLNKMTSLRDLLTRLKNESKVS